ALVWGLGLWKHSNDTASANASCKRQVAAANPSPTPTASSSAKPSPTPTPAASSTPVAVPGCTAGGKSEQPPGLVNLGLDLQGGLSVVLQPKPGQKFDQATLQQAANIIGLRIDSLGVAEPDIAVQGNTIQV